MFVIKSGVGKIGLKDDLSLANIIFGHNKLDWAELSSMLSSKKPGFDELS